MILKRVGIFSAAKISGIIGVVIGLVFGFATAIVGNISELTGTTTELGWSSVIIFPLVYGLLGFVGGAIYAFLYNQFAKLVGGIELELEH